MKVTPVKTRKVEPGSGDIFGLLDDSLKNLSEGSIVAITSKVVAICEGRVVPIGKEDLQKLVIQESDYYLPLSLNKFGFSFTIVHNTLIPRAGIDESNGNGNYILWPENPVESANKIRDHLIKKYDLKKIGVVITDSTARPLHYGLEGTAIGYSGFLPQNDFVGKPDLFGRNLTVTYPNIADSLAAAAVLVMGESNEQMPITVIEDVPFIEFQDRNPTKEELDKFYISMDKDDLFDPFLKNMPWQKGKHL